MNSYRAEHKSRFDHIQWSGEEGCQRSWERATDGSLVRLHQRLWGERFRIVEATNKGL